MDDCYVFCTLSMWSKWTQLLVGVEALSSTEIVHATGIDQNNTCNYG